MFYITNKPAVKEGGGLGWLSELGLRARCKCDPCHCAVAHNFADFEQEPMLGAPGWLEHQPGCVCVWICLYVCVCVFVLGPSWAYWNSLRCHRVARVYACARVRVCGDIIDYSSNHTPTISTTIPPTIPRYIQPSHPQPAQPRSTTLKPHSPHSHKATHISCTELMALIYVWGFSCVNNCPSVVTD